MTRSKRSALSSIKLACLHDSHDTPLLHDPKINFP